MDIVMRARPEAYDRVVWSAARRIESLSRLAALERVRRTPTEASRTVERP